MSDEMMDFRPLDDVDITDDFMFAYVMRNPDICVELLRYLLPEKRIAKIEYITDNGDGRAPQKHEIQKTMLGEIGKRGVRLDAYLDDGKTIYNIEMQTAREVALPKRMRLYASHIDMNQLERGDTYDMLRPSFVIFICKFDPFDRGLYRYAFENVCTNAENLRLNDESFKLFFSTVGTRGDISDRLRQLLEYMNNTRSFPVKETGNVLVKTIDRAVNTAKNDEEWRRAYMQYQMNLRDAELRGERRGEKRGEKLGEARMNQQWEKHMMSTAKSLIARGIPIDEVAMMTNLPISKIRELQGEANLKH